MRRKNFHYSHRAYSCFWVLRNEKYFFRALAFCLFPPNSWAYSLPFARFKIPERLEKIFQNEKFRTLSLRKCLLFISSPCACECAFLSEDAQKHQKKYIFHSWLVSQINKSIISLHTNPTRNFKKACTMLNNWKWK